jgi:hypothetical protein
MPAPNYGATAGPAAGGDYMDESAPSEDASMANAPEKEQNATPENKLALVQTSFFKEPPKPGDREMVEVVDVYENEVSIKCVYDEEEEPTEEAAPDMEMMGNAAPPTDQMMT